MNTKKIFILLVILVLIFTAVYIIAVKLAFTEWDDGITGKSEEIKESSLGDKFLFRYVTRNFPDLDTTVTVMEYTEKKEIVYFVIDGEFYESELVTIIDLPKSRVYEIYGVLIYRVGNSDFNGIFINRIEEIDPTEHPLFIEVAKDLVSKKEWKWIKACGNFLLKAGDTETRETLENYALGQFSYEELELNKNGEIEKEDMQAFAIRILEQNK